MSARTGRRDRDASLLIGGLLTVAFGGFAVMLAIGIGWLGAALLGIALIVLAWRVPTTARVLPVILAALGVVAVLGAVLDLLTRAGR